MVESGPRLLVQSRASRRADDYDVLMCYQVFLGRNPENSFVIEEAKTQSVETIIRSFLASSEFAVSVLGRRRSGSRLPHVMLSAAPLPEQIAWLADQLDMDEAQGAALREVADWDTLVDVLAGLAGDEEAAPGPGAAAAAASMTVPSREGAMPVAMPDASTAERSALEIDELRSRLERIEQLLLALQRNGAEPRIGAEPRNGAERGLGGRQRPKPAGRTGSRRGAGRDT